jgi:archaellum biogenesis ATPase FlaH
MLITRVWKNQPGDYFCISTKSKSGKWTDKFFTRKQLSKVRAFVNANLDKDVYFCPHGFTEPRRLKEYAVMPNLLWADLDEADPSKIKVMPSVAIQSSPGRYVGLWFTDRPVDESINRRLTYLVGADHGGWDVTQVLRFPGTSNYKYDNPPRVKVMWQDGPSYELDEIIHVLPPDELIEANLGEAIGVYRRYEKHLSMFARREILKGKPKRGKRSEVLWRLNKEMMEAGMTSDEAFSILVVSPWNKFKGRRNGSKQLRRELEKSMEQKFDSVPIEVDEDQEERFLVTSLADVEVEQLDWIWYPYLARKELTILEGDPGLGKSYVAQMIGAAIVDGKRLPTVKAHPAVKGKVAYFDLENSAGTVTKARLVDNGCKNMKDYYQDEQVFMIDDEDIMERVYEGLERIQPDLVVFDTLNTYIGKADVHKASETQQAMKHFVEIARRFNCSCVVLRHLTKSTKEKALYRGQGSIAFTGMARVVMTVGQHPEDDNVRVMAVTKLNVTKIPDALTFEIKSLPDTLKRQDRSELVWGDFVDLTADEIMMTSPAKKKRGDEVEDFLRDLLESGPMTKGAVERAAKARGISIKIVLRTAAAIGVVRQKKGYAGKRTSVWALPTTGAPRPDQEE